MVNLQMVFPLGDLCLHCFVVLLIKWRRKKGITQKREGAEPFGDRGSVSLHCGPKGAENGLFATTVPSTVVDRTSITLPHKKLHKIRIVQRSHIVENVICFLIIMHVLMLYIYSDSTKMLNPQRSVRSTYSETVFKWAIRTSVTLWCHTVQSPPSAMPPVWSWLQDHWQSWCSNIDSGRCPA